jgi:hypothetical protein
VARRSQRQWLSERRYLNEHRYELTRAAQELYPASWRVAGTPLLSRPEWLAAEPVSLDAVALSWRPGRHGTVVDGTEPASAGVRPMRDGVRYGSYAAAVGALSRPRLFEDRTCYRLLEASAPAGGAHLAFGTGRYFDVINVCEAVAHEIAAGTLVRQDPGAPLTLTGLPLRSKIGDPLDLRRRPVMTGISTLTLRLDRGAGDPRMVLHWRDPARVASGGGLYQVAPVGMFQPSHDAEWNLANDFSLWRSITRELSEELLGTSESYGSDAAPIDYGRWPFHTALTDGRRAGALRGYLLGLGTDPLTLVTDLLTVIVFDAGLFDAALGGLVRRNDEGRMVTGPGPPGGAAGVAFSASSVERFTTAEAMQPAGAALLRLAWQHRKVLLKM